MMPSAETMADLYELAVKVCFETFHHKFNLLWGERHNTFLSKFKCHILISGFSDGVT